MVDKNKIQDAVKQILDAVDVRLDDEVYQNTPSRVARMYEEISSGYDESVEEILSHTFAQEGRSLVIEKDIPFSSTCEHHLMPFFGRVHIAYVSDGKVVGLSKLARVVDVYAKRFQLQERMTSQIADAIYEHLSARGVMVAVVAEHTCMTARGVKKVGSKTVTTALRGKIPDEVKAQLISACY